MRMTFLGGAIAAALAMAAPAGAVTINFDNLVASTVVTNQYADATFSAASGPLVVLGSAASFGTSVPNFICSAACATDFSVAFTAPVNNLTFLALGDGAAGTTGLIDVFDSNGLIATVNLVTDGVSTVPDLMNLSAFSNVTAITIRSITDPAGLGFDDFNFNVGATTSTPEPASAALLVGGLLALGLRRRRA